MTDHLALHVGDCRKCRDSYRAGRRDNGAPGLLPRYRANYYAAFVFEPDGHNIETVRHAPGSPAYLTENF